ncbi:DUF3231 family protein [Sporotomaculum syntrophicum]|nr:DUF3231 family protein [Sporotomaculum syntrophicum]
MIFGKNSRQVESLKLDTNEAYTLWRAYTDMNLTIGHMSLIKNFIHDADFVVYLSKTIEDLKKECHTIEKLMQKYSIAAPEPAVDNNKTSGNSEVLTDRNAAEVLYRFIRLDVNLMALSLKYPPTNDDIWSFMVGLTKSALYRIDSLIKYMKLKNWVNEPPLYPYVPPDNHEQVATNEIALLWEHLIYRYHSIRQIQNFLAFASDPDLITLLKMIIGLMQGNINTLEDKLVYYGVSLPKHYSNIIVNVEDKTIVPDRYLLSSILQVMRNAIVLHVSLIQEVIVNDKLRKFFIDLSLSEIDDLGKITKYGKVKGWVFTTPIYKV